MWKRDKHKADQTEYKEQEKLTSNMIRKAKRRFERRLADSGNGSSRPFFAYIKQRTKSRPAIGPLMKDGQKVTGDAEMAELLNNCFGDVFTRRQQPTSRSPT